MRVAPSCNSYATGTADGGAGNSDEVGGLVGRNNDPGQLCHWHCIWC